MTSTILVKRSNLLGLTCFLAILEPFCVCLVNGCIIPKRVLRAVKEVLKKVKCGAKKWLRGCSLRGI